MENFSNKSLIYNSDFQTAVIIFVLSLFAIIVFVLVFIFCKMFYEEEKNVFIVKHIQMSRSPMSISPMSRSPISTKV